MNCCASMSIWPTPTMVRSARAASARTRLMVSMSISRSRSSIVADDHRQRDRIVLRLGQIGEPGQRVEEARRAVGRDVADERDELVVRAVHRADLVDGRAQRAAGAERDDHGSRGCEPLLEEGPGACRNAGDRGEAGRVGRHDIAMPEREALGKARSQAPCNGRSDGRAAP